jgi:hypothetical protein
MSFFDYSRSSSFSASAMDFLNSANFFIIYMWASDPSALLCCFKVSKKADFLPFLGPAATDILLYALDFWLSITYGR